MDDLLSGTSVPLTITLPLVLALLLAAVPAVFLQLRMVINGAAFIGAVRQLVASDRAPMVARLCEAAGTVPLARATRALIAAWEDGVRDRDALRAAFDEPIPATLSTLAAFRRLFAAATLLAAVAAFAWVLQGQPLGPPLLLGPAAVVATVAWSEWTARRVLSDLDLARDALGTLFAATPLAGHGPDRRDAEPPNPTAP